MPNGNILNLTNLYGVTPLHYACYFGNKRVIDLLLNLGADIDAKDDEGNSCLHFAINSSCIATIKKLIIRGVDKSIKRNDNLTAYDLALQNNEFKIAEVLKKIGFFDKYICMRTELTSFNYTRNNIILIFIFTTLVVLKTIYLIKLYTNFPVDTNKSITELMSTKQNSLNKNFRNMIEEKIFSSKNKGCLILDSETCLFDLLFEIFTSLSIIIDFLIILSVFYFNCCFKSRKELKIRERSLIVK